MKIVLVGLVRANPQAIEDAICSDEILEKEVERHTVTEWITEDFIDSVTGIRIAEKLYNVLIEAGIKQSHFAIRVEF